MNKVVICGVNTATLPKITEKQSVELLEKIKKGDAVSREQFIVSNMRLVLSVIKRFKSTKKSKDDLFQAGCIGLIKAIDNFDCSFGVKFSTYAVPMIIGEIKRILRDTNSLRVPRSIRDTAYQALKTRGELEKGNNEVPLSVVAEHMNVAVTEVVYALDAISDTVSLFEPVCNKSGDELLLVDQIGDQKCSEELWTENVALQSAMGNLNDRERKIIYLRYFEGKTQTEISTEVGISQAQVSRIEKTALSSIRRYISI